MRRFFFGAVTLIAATALAATLTVEEVNKKVTEITAPYNDADTIVQLQFNKLSVDEVRAKEFDFSFKIAEEGSANEVRLNGAGTYEYAVEQNEPSPTFTANFDLEFPIVKLLGQKVVNETAEGLAELVPGIISSYTEEFGAAGQIDARVSNIQRDEEGNITRVELLVDAVIDMAQLPEEVLPSEVEFKRISAALIFRADGVAVNVSGVLNPEYVGFQEDAVGAKELIEGLLLDDEKTYADISDSLEALYNFVQFWASLELDAELM